MPKWHMHSRSGHIVVGVACGVLSLQQCSATVYEYNVSTACKQLIEYKMRHSNGASFSTEHQAAVCKLSLRCIVAS
jgi:hypothetical protein